MVMEFTIKDPPVKAKSVIRKEITTKLGKLPTLGNALACAAMMVMSPGCGLGLFNGVYCLIAS